MMDLRPSAETIAMALEVMGLTLYALLAIWAAVKRDPGLQREAIDAILSRLSIDEPQGHNRCRVELANYFAAARPGGKVDQTLDELLEEAESWLEQDQQAAGAAEPWWGVRFWRIIISILIFRRPPMAGHQPWQPG